jgi:hypothetical protein
MVLPRTIVTRQTQNIPATRKKVTTGVDQFSYLGITITDQQEKALGSTG